MIVAAPRRSSLPAACALARTLRALVSTTLPSPLIRSCSGGWTRDDTPLFPSLRDLLEQADPDHRTLFTVADDAAIDGLVAAAQRVVGDFDAADSGLLFTVPVGRVLGLGRRK